MCYCPVAVTLQLRIKLTVAPVENDASVRPPPSRPGHDPGAGHTPVPLAAQLVTEQFSPAPGVSATVLPSLAAGPRLAKVTV